MRNLLIGAAVGAAVVYLVLKGKESGGLDKMCEDVKDYTAKVKKDVKNVWDKSVNNAEYAKELAENKVEVIQQKVNKKAKR